MFRKGNRCYIFVTYLTSSRKADKKYVVPKSPTSTITPTTPTIKLTTTQMLKMRLEGYSYQDIGNKAGVSRHSVRDRLKTLERVIGDPQLTSAYREHEADILDGLRRKIATSLANKADDKKASINNLAYAFTQINQAVRLLRGQSTANVSALTRIIEQAQERKPAYSVPQHIDFTSQNNANIQESTPNSNTSSEKTSIKSST